jgi:hypothetical protein
MTADTLKNYSCKHLAELARKDGVQGWHAMRKDQLVRALLRSKKKPAAAVRKSAAQRPPAAGRKMTLKAALAKSPAPKIRAAVAKTATVAKVPMASVSQVSGKAPVNGKAAHSNGKAATSNGHSAIANGKPLAAKQVVTKPAVSNGKPLSNGKPVLANGKPVLANGKPVLANGKAATNGKLLHASDKAAPANGKPHTNGKAELLPPHAKLPAAKLPTLKPALEMPVVEKKVVEKKAIVEKPAKDSVVAKRLQRIKAKHEHAMDLSQLSDARAGGGKDRLIVMVRDSYWLHAYWELSRQGVERARAALGQEWHATKPVLRLLQISSSGTATSAESLVRDIEIHGGVNNWYVDVQDPPKNYRMEIGYRSVTGKFFVLARSNVVSTPRPGSRDAIDENWSAVAEDYDKIYALSGGYSADGASIELQELFEERLRRPMGSPMVTHYGTPVDGLVHRKRDFSFDLDAELIVYGVTEPNAHVTLQGDPVKLRPDGTFTVRFSLPNCRQVIPAVACSADGVEQRTVVLAVERNTKVMEPLIRDAND